MASLGNDLASIRKELNLSIEEIKQKTKIPIRILKSIEDDSIFAGMQENNTYTRSYVRSYAKAIKIADEHIVRALNQVQKENYQGILTEGSPSERRPAFEDDTPREAAEEPSEDMIHDHSPEFTGDDADEAKEEKKAPPARPLTPPPSVDTIDWADMGRKFTPMETKSRLWVGVSILVVIILSSAAVIWYQFYSTDKDGTETITQNETTLPAVSPDSLQLDLTTPTVGISGGTDGADATALESLPDTLNMVIYAVYDKLEPVRVFTDVINSLNPYWIEQGEAFKFEFVNKIEFRGQYSRMALLFNGHLIDNFRQQFLNPQTGMVEINRSYFEDDPQWLQPGPDSLNIPQPIVIKDRPTFN